MPPSNPTVIVRNDSSYKNSSIPVPEAYLLNRTPTILTVPAVKLASNKDPRQANSMHNSRLLSSSVSTSQSKGYNSFPEPHHPGPLLNTHGRYILYPPLTDKAQRELNTPPPAHLNAMISSAVPTFVPVAVPVDDLQTEALDQVMICNKATPETDIPLHLNSNYEYAKPDPQDTISTHDINVGNNSKKRNYSEIDLPNNGNVSSSLTPLTSNSATKSTINTTASSVTSCSNVPITNSISYDSLPSISPPVLIPATDIDMSREIRYHLQKLKKVWLQRYLWTEYLKEAGVNIDQNSYSFSQMDDIPPILECELSTKKKKI